MKAPVDGLLSAVATAIEEDINRQYKDGLGVDWKKPKDAIDRLDYYRIAAVSLLARADWTSRFLHSIHRLAP